MKTPLKPLLTLFLLTIAIPQTASTTAAMGQRNIQGRIWQSATGKFVSIQDMFDDVSTKKYIVIGERHGRKAHQDREAFLLAALASKKRYPSVVLEMLTTDQTRKVSLFRNKSPENPQMLGRELHWSKSNWPAWQFYLPVFEIAFAAKLPIIGADLTDSQKNRILSAPPVIPNLETKNPDIMNSWSDSLRKSHCNLVDEARLKRLTNLQIQRDQTMAAIAKMSVGNKDGIVIIAGSAHARKDRGIPLYLPTSQTVVIALKETKKRLTARQHAPKPADNKTFPYDYIWLTANRSKTSVCDRLDLR